VAPEQLRPGAQTQPVVPPHIPPVDDSQATPPELEPLEDVEPEPPPLEVEPEFALTQQIHMLGSPQTVVGISESQMVPLDWQVPPCARQSLPGDASVLPELLDVAPQQGPLPPGGQEHCRPV